MSKVIAIVGPTASGKSSLSILAAKRLGGEIISADSMQVYQGMDIGTAKITKEEMQGIEHHLIDIQPLNEAWNVKLFQQMCRQKISEIQARNHIPILCGGTGLYVKAALYDYAFEEEDPNEAKIMTEISQWTNDQLFAYLEQEDPQALEKIHPNNRQRLLRAAVMAKSGKRKSDREANQKHEPIYDVYMIGLKDDREIEIERIDKRVDQMFEQGLADEVKRLFNTPESRTWNSFQGIGYKEFLGWLEEKEDLDSVCEQIKIHTRQYARRQMTWFNHQMPVHWYKPCQKEEILKDLEEWYGK